jgi:hypothetical protein
MIPSIGFDMDQCLVEAFNLVPFIIFFETKLRGIDLETQALIKKSRDIFYELIAASEITNPTIFRPSLVKLIAELIHLKKEGKIKHMFIYSNNGYLQILNAIDHILALIIKKAPYSVNDQDLVWEDGRQHVLTPRIYIDSTCRVNTEPKIVNFREKSLSGIHACLNDNIPAEELWFLDDSLQHTDLKTKLGNRYINVEAYKVHISNSILVNYFLKSLPKRVFISNMPLYDAVIPVINKVFIFENAVFYPSGKEPHERLVEKFHEVMIKNEIFKPEIASRKWTKQKIETDYTLIKKLLPLFTSADKATPRLNRNVERTPSTNPRRTYGGNPSSRRNRFRILRTRRKSRR